MNRERTRGKNCMAEDQLYWTGSSEGEVIYLDGCEDGPAVEGERTLILEDLRRSQRYYRVEERERIADARRCLTVGKRRSRRRRNEYCEPGDVRQ